MYLKSIDMYGFKSFANKIAFSFDEGITAIVGPNGSGKSNIADAVRWVLGEQSPKNLRGSNMKDVIFAGTETRRPLGYCQVDLTIDNADQKMAISYSEVTVSRRVYRSGESEYFINGTACRMKDIHELFMDTGVGKEGYSIIGQGQIDKILSSKPDDRRGLFDEAAGIVKYKKRKVNAEKQLEEEEQNLIRINDIIRELKGQEESLRSQSEVAKVYLQLKESLKKNEVNIYLNEVESMDKKIQELSEKEGIVYDQISDARKEKEALTKQQTDTANSLESVDQQIANNQHESTQIAVEKEKRESNIKLTKEQINNIKVNNNRIQIENKTLSDKMQLKESELSLYEEQLKGVKETTKQQVDEVEAYEETLQQKNALIQSNERAIETIQADMIERLNEISNTKSKILRLNTLLEGNESRLGILKAEKTKLDEDENTIGLAATKGRLDLDQVDKKRADYEKEKEVLIKSLTTALTKKETQQNQLNVLRSHANKIESKHKALSEIAEGYEGYQHSTKSIMTLKLKNQPLGKGVLGVVSDILKVDQKFEKAVEIALGNKIQNIITDTEETAKSLIGYLKQNRYGRATFLPLNGITALRPNPQIDKSETGFYGYGNEVVGCEAKYDHILDYMIGRIGIVEDMEVGTLISKKYNRKVHLVTLAGEEIRPGGSITGGESSNRGNQLLGRKRQLEEIEVEIQGINQQVVLAEKALDQLQIQINGQEKKKAFLIEEEKNLSIEFNRLAIELKQLETELIKHKEEKQSIIDELAELEQQEIAYTDQVKTLEKTLEGTEGENVNKETHVKELLEAITQLKVAKEAVSETLTELKVKASASQSQLNHVKENKDRILKELEEINSQIITNNEAIMANETEITEKSLSITEALEASNESDVSIREKEQLIKGLNDEKHGLSKAREELYQQRELVNEQINQLEKELIRLQNQKEKIENAKNEQSTYMWNEYEITINNVTNYLDNTLGTVGDMRKAIKSLKNEIKDLGPVNVNSIEAYKSVSERYEFLTAQRDDLIESKEQIMEVIEELKHDMEVQFREKFKEISKKFTEVFKELFGGGKAFLELVEDHNILEAGIEIIAQPPGKKLQSMMLLSGGEKAFTAISLLFAIQSLKPSPFCVLDEIEAALDDANVVRFANYLSKLTKNTQFIIITHRKGTMEAADALYGITMQEKGISTQVSVKLLEDSIKE